MPKSIPAIRLKGVRQNNLKGFDLEIPLGKLTLVTGLSGTGKSSLVFETLHAEGQRRYVETFSAYTRQFLEILERPEVDSIENIHPSIAIEQTNSVKTTRSTVGTMTELNDYFRVWFSHVATLHDPLSGEPIQDDSPQRIADQLSTIPEKTLLITFQVPIPKNLQRSEVIDALTGQGYTRGLVEGSVLRLEQMLTLPQSFDHIYVIQDRVTNQASSRSRILESLEAAYRYGKDRIHIFDTNVNLIASFTRGLVSPVNRRKFHAPTPARFSFNSPLGACPTCRGFGRIISIDPKLVIPDPRLSINQGAIRPFQGQVYSECLRDLRRHALDAGIDLHLPWEELSPENQNWVWNGDPGYPQDAREDEAWKYTWYGIKRFFEWLEKNTYKMHVRVFLSKFRAYHSCPSCGGARLNEEALCWKWQGYRLPDLFDLPISELKKIFDQVEVSSSDPRLAAATRGIISRLGFLNHVDLGYLTLNRPSRTLSGGETQRVNLTSSLGASVVDTLFVLDEPSIGLHPRDVHRVNKILRALVDQGNTVVVVEHDESVMRIADHLIELGPQPGDNGGEVVFTGSLSQMLRSRKSLTGAYLSGRRQIEPPRHAPPSPVGAVIIENASKHNLHNLSTRLPLGQLVGIAGVSGSGKSTFMESVLYGGLLRMRGEPVENPAEIERIEIEGSIGALDRVDQSTVSKTPRSNPAIYSGAWEEIRKQLAATEGAKASGLGPGHFSFNSGDGRCPNCDGLGAIKTEMQFLADIYTPCPVCNGRRFREEILAIEWQGLTVDKILELDINTALLKFAGEKKILAALQPLADVGLGYLRLGQPLNTLSGGESQRLKLVRYLAGISKQDTGALLLLDEPTTGLHRDDVGRLIAVLRSLVQQGHSIVVVEHQSDVLRACDWIIEFGPEAGARGGRIVAAGPPSTLALGNTATAPYLRDFTPEEDSSFAEQAAEDPILYAAATRHEPVLRIEGAREHNLKNVSTSIKHGSLTVITGVSGSGKSSLAFDTIFAEGQRRFLESMSSYARQFVEQMPRADCDRLTGIAPTIAIEQRVTRGTSKSTVGTITEVAQLLRLLYARLGIVVNPVTGNRATASTIPAIQKELLTLLTSPSLKKAPAIYLAAPVVRGRKGHHQPLADWAAAKGYPFLRCDGKLVPTSSFKKLERYREHDLDLITLDLASRPFSAEEIGSALAEALRLGKGACYLLLPNGTEPARYSLTQSDPVTGEALPELDPKDFSWNSPRGWCPTCRGHGLLTETDEDAEDEGSQPEGSVCPDCMGSRLNPVARNVLLDLSDGESVTLPQLLKSKPSEILSTLRKIQTDQRGQQILASILPEIEERLAFMTRVGLDYLSLDRSTRTLSGGEAQRIRLAAQLGSNLSGVLYVLDEPSIGLHARDNESLLQSLQLLRQRGNTILVVEHDDAIMRCADHLIDMGPGAGVHGGQIVSEGPPASVLRDPQSLTGKLLREGMPHPLNGQTRGLPPPWNPRSLASRESWLVLDQPKLRNLKGGQLKIPLGRLTVVAGVSGAGKSTLIRDLLSPALTAANHSPKATLRELLARDPRLRTPAPEPILREIRGAHRIRKIIEVDQAPIGKTSRSIPATFIGIFDLIRQHFASLPEARQRGYDAARFSFNTSGGRCETCKGAGRVKLEMNFLPNAYVTCDACGGSRYSEETLQIRWRDLSIADVLNLNFAEAAEFFDFNQRIADLCSLMVEAGLGYIRLGQSSPTLSGGEAQRLKLVAEINESLNRSALRKPALTNRALAEANKGNLYILEEPTIGLHLSDVQRLLHLLHRLVGEGHTVLVIEHHLDVLAEADYLVEIGPQGGDAGGEILYQGPPSEISSCPDSPTLPYLEPLLRGLVASPPRTPANKVRMKLTNKIGR
ncbi:MAG: excinuclease ABC subunit UvrA [Puniceicoccaceae bacterium]